MARVRRGPNRSRHARHRARIATGHRGRSHVRNPARVAPLGGWNADWWLDCVQAFALSAARVDFGTAGKYVTPRASRRGDCAGRLAARVSAARLARHAVRDDELCARADRHLATRLSAGHFGGAPGVTRLRHGGRSRRDDSGRFSGRFRNRAADSAGTGRLGDGAADLASRIITADVGDVAAGGGGRLHSRRGNQAERAGGGLNAPTSRPYAVSTEVSVSAPTLPLMLGALVVLLICARVPDVIRHGRFWAEEGRDFFRYAWEHPWYRALAHPYGGYLNLVANCGTILAHVLAPLKYAPYVTIAIALFFQVC